MLLISCPFCGERAEIEFIAGGEAITRPENPAILDEARLTDYLYNRDNRRGALREQWWHAHGCRRWLVVERDTQSNAILSVHDAQSVLGDSAT